MQGPVPTVTAGDVLSFSLTVAFEGAGSASTQLTLTAQQSAVMAVLSGPRGDVLVRTSVGATGDWVCLQCEAACPALSSDFPIHLCAATLRASAGHPGPCVWLCLLP